MAAGGKFASFRWLSNPFDQGFGKAFEIAFEAGLAEYTQGFAQRVQEYARANAPWEDRSGDARDGLTAKGYYKFTKYEIVLYHTVDYGIWLEVRWGGRYAIIIPTIEHMGREFMQELDMAQLLRAL